MWGSAWNFERCVAILIRLACGECHFLIAAICRPDYSQKPYITGSD